MIQDTIKQKTRLELPFFKFP